MNLIAVLPNTVITPSGIVAQAFLSRNLKTSNDAIAFSTPPPFHPFPPFP